MSLGKLTVPGVAILEDHIEKLKSHPNAKLSESLKNPAYCDFFADNFELNKREFASRFDIAEYLYSLLSKIGLPELENNLGLWTWLTAQYIDILCPLQKNSTRKINEAARYIPELSNYKKYYRHLLLGPYLIYKAHADNPARAMALLCQPVHVVSEVVEQIASRQEFITNPTIVQLVTNLYYDAPLQTMKKGTGGKDPGSPRRLVTILQQFELTYDLYAMDIDEMTILLPKEFDKFR